MSPEKSPNQLHKIIPKPIRRLIANVVELTRVTFAPQYHAESLVEREERKKLQEQTRVTHVLGMSLADSIKKGEDAAEQTISFRDALNALPAEMNITSVGLDEEQLGFLGKYFEIPPPEEQ